MLLHAPARDVLRVAGDGTVTTVDGERCTLGVGSWSWGALATSFGRFEVIKPAELVEAFVVQAGRFAEAGRSSSAEVVPRGS